MIMSELSGLFILRIRQWTFFRKRCVYAHCKCEHSYHDHHPITVYFEGGNMLMQNGSNAWRGIKFNELKPINNYKHCIHIILSLAILYWCFSAYVFTEQTILQNEKSALICVYSMNEWLNHNFGLSPTFTDYTICIFNYIFDIS